MGNLKEGGGRLGRAFRREHVTKGYNASNIHEGFLHSTELDDGCSWGMGMNSVTESGDLEEFLATAELADRQFAGERLNIKIMNYNEEDPVDKREISEELKAKKREKEQGLLNFIRCPRRPVFGHELKKEDTLMLNQKERENFLTWRRDLANVLESNVDLIVTPFEKNIEVWRQFWRVMERSDVVVQIVDARSPLLFLNKDVFSYAHEINPHKQNLLIINKADYLNKKQRQYWANYFKEQNIEFVFWSAFLEEERMKMVKHVQDVLDDDLALFEDIDRFQIYDEISKQDLEQLKKTDEVMQSMLFQQENLYVYDFLPAVLREKVIECVLSQKKDAMDPENYANQDLDEQFSVLNLMKVNKKKLIKKSNQGQPIIISENMDTPVPGIDANSLGNSLTYPKLEELAQTIPINEDDVKILNGCDLFRLLLGLTEGGKNVIGLIGYPNVGKSTTVNAIIKTYNFVSVSKKNKNKVSVSSTPGHTKHFQTIVFDELDFFPRSNPTTENSHPFDNTIVLCDCPGLVFPMFMNSKADMIVNGILPADQLREPIAPATIIAKRVPRKTIEAIYGFEIIKPHRDENQDRPPTGDELLHAFGRARSFFTNHGLPDIQRVARLLIKDFINGKLLYCDPAPNADPADYNPQLIDVGIDDTPITLRNATKNLLYSTTGQFGGVRDKYYDEVDKDFLNNKPVKVFAQGKLYRGTEFTRVQHFPYQSKGKAFYEAHAAASPVDPITGEPTKVVGKPWKIHNNYNKKEKLRRLQKNDKSDQKNNVL